MNILTKIKNLLVESLKDNWKLIVGLYIIFIVLFAAAWLLSPAYVSSTVAQLPANATAGNVGELADPVELFVLNEWGGILTYFLSVFFAVPAIVSLVYNAVNMGISGQLFSQIIPNGGAKFLIYLIPHGIFELTATVIESAAGIMLFLFIWRFVRSWKSLGASTSFENHKKILIQSVVLMIFSTVLLLIAAPIESYFSVPFSEFFIH